MKNVKKRDKPICLNDRDKDFIENAIDCYIICHRFFASYDEHITARIQRDEVLEKLGIE